MKTSCLRMSRLQRQQFALLISIIDAASATASFPATLSRVLSKIMQLAECESGGIRVIDHAARTLSFMSYKGLTRQFYNSEKTVTFSECLCGKVASGKEKMVVMNNIPALLRKKRIAGAMIRGGCITAGYKSKVVLPIYAGDEILAVLYLASYELYKFPRGLVELLHTVCGQIGMLIKRNLILKELQAKNKKIRELNCNLEGRIEEGVRRIKEAETLALVGKLSAGIVHEINNPLYGISSYLELLADENDRQKQKQYVEVIARGVAMIQSVTGSLLDLALLNRLRIEPTDVNSLLREIIMLAVTDNHKRVRVVTRLQKDFPLLLLDTNKMRQVLLNVVTNALEAMPEGGVLTVASARRNGMISLTVADTGKGIPSKHLPHIFEPFFSLKSAEKKRGTGLGLFVASKIVSLHKGTIEIKSKARKGSVCTISMPLRATAGES